MYTSGYSGGAQTSEVDLSSSKVNALNDRGRRHTSAWYQPLSKSSSVVKRENQSSRKTVIIFRY